MINQNVHNSSNVYFTILASNLSSRLQESLKKNNTPLPDEKVKLVNKQLAYIGNMNFKASIV